MLKTVPATQAEPRAALELPLASMADYPGTVALLDSDGSATIVGGTVSLIETLQDSGHWQVAEVLASRAIAARRAAVVVLGDGADGPIEATFLPAGGGTALVLLRALDFERALRRSLIESRQRFKDLVEIVSDFTWETDAAGRFSFVSPLGALDWSAHELVGHRVSEFIAGGETSLPPPVFRAHAPGEDSDVWFRRADGESDCLAVAAVPLFDADGVWLGARGLCRRVTDEWRRNRDAAHGHLRDRLVTHLARTIGDEIDPLRALAAAASATGLALSASGAAICRGGLDDLVIAAHWGIEPGAALLAAARQAIAGLPPIPGSDDRHRMICATRFHGASNGIVMLWREADQDAFTAEDRVILDAVADPFGVAIALLARHETTSALARTDPLTELLNRRGFSEEVARRMARLERSGQNACLVYLDLDNFKLVNDTHGHKAGDNALLELSRILRSGSRGGDVIGRLGGDEFVMWLDGIGDGGIEQRAERILAACRPLAALSGDLARPLGVSLGLAVYDPAQAETPEALLARADAAMYRVKQHGKGRFAIAAPPTGASETDS